MKRKHQIICIVLVLLFLLPLPKSALAYDYTGFNQIVNQIRNTYPDGTYWTNETSYPAGWWGCWAFANMMADNIFGTATPRNSWTTTSASQIVPGDIITTDTWNGSGWNYGHTMFVIGVSGDTLTIAEGNYSGAVKWGRTLGRYSESFTVYHAPNYDSVIPNVVYVTVSFNSQGGSSVSSRTIQKGTAVGSLPSTSRSGYTFKGWYTASSGGTKISSSTVVNSNVTYYAQWTANESYTVTFDPQGGTSVSSMSVPSGGIIGNGYPTSYRSGYTFVGWFTAKTGGTLVRHDQSITSNVTYYAQWIQTNPSGYSVGNTYPNNLKNAEATSVVDPWNFYNRGAASFVAWCLNSRNGIDFHNYYGGVLWGNSNNWSSAASSLGITVNSTPAIGAVAFWNSHGDYGHTAWVRAVSGDFMVIDEYNVNGDGNFSTRVIPISYPDGFIHIADITVVENVTVTFDSQGGTSVSSQTVQKGSAIGALPTTSRTGYTFDGWYTAATGGTKISSGTTVNSNVTYYAHWTPATYTVTYNANGGSGAPAAQTKTHDVALTLSNTVPSRSGYTFRGWATSSTASTAQYQPGASYTANENVTLYAVWTKDAPPVTDDGMVVVGSDNGRPGTEISIPVSINGNPGIASFQFDVIYDDTVLEWTGIEKSTIGGTWDAAVGESILWIDADNYTSDGTIFTLKFVIKDNAQSGTYSVTVSYDPDNVFDENGNNVRLGITAGTVTVSTHIPGDINGDGSVNNKDLLWLMKWIKGKDVDVVYEALDVNGDGSRNNKDLLWLMKFLKGKDVIIY